MDILGQPWPCKLVESCIEAIWARRGIAAHVFDDGVQLLNIWDRVGEGILRCILISITCNREVSSVIRLGRAMGDASRRVAKNVLEVDSESGTKLL